VQRQLRPKTSKQIRRRWHAHAVIHLKIVLHLYVKAYVDKKGLRGVTRRFAFFVLDHGPDAVRRPVLGCHTLTGGPQNRQIFRP
jgi:hypothetical protein